MCGNISRHYATRSEESLRFAHYSRLVLASQDMHKDAIGHSHVDTLRWPWDASSIAIVDVVISRLTRLFRPPGIHLDTENGGKSELSKKWQPVAVGRTDIRHCGVRSDLSGQHVRTVRFRT